MEGVLATAPALANTSQKDPVEDMEGIKHDAFFALQHAPELGASVAALMPVV